MPILVPASGFAQSVDEIESRLLPFGSITVTDDGDASRRLRFVVEAPGFGLPTLTIFEFVEWFDRTAQGWLRVRYKFEYRPAASRKAHHQQGSWGFHQHCEPPGHASTDHYEDDERLIMQTIDAFTRLYASRQPIQCVGLRRLRSRRTRTDSEESVAP